MQDSAIGISFRSILSTKHLRTVQHRYEQGQNYGLDDKYFLWSIWTTSVVKITCLTLEGTVKITRQTLEATE